MWLTATGENGDVLAFEAPGEGEEKIIGRRVDTDVVLPNSSVSRRHARVLCAGGQYFVEDLGSSLGTFLNQLRVDVMTPFAPGDELLIASYVVRLSDHPDGMPSARPAPSPTGGASGTDPLVSHIVRQPWKL